MFYRYKDEYDDCVFNLDYVSCIYEEERTYNAKKQICLNINFIDHKNTQILRTDLKNFMKTIKPISFPKENSETGLSSETSKTKYSVTEPFEMQKNLKKKLKKNLRIKNICCIFAITK